MILALLLAISWDPYPAGRADFLEVSAWVVEPVVLPCPEPEVGDCIVAYLETWRAPALQLPLTATRAEWVAPELVSRGVAFMRVRAGRTTGDGVCWSGGRE